MADIPVERRSSNNMWKWLGGLALLAVVVVLVISLVDTDEPTDEPAERPLQQQEQPQQQPPPPQQEQQEPPSSPNGQSSDLMAPNDAEALPLTAEAASYWNDYTVV